jgi:hypothetical protein
LLHRYLAEIRNEQALRIDVEEARKIRKAMEKAIYDIVTVSAEADRIEEPSMEDLRDEVTKLADGFIAAAASVPEWLTRRLDAAFDASFK